MLLNEKLQTRSRHFLNKNSVNWSQVRTNCVRQPDCSGSWVIRDAVKDVVRFPCWSPSKLHMGKINYRADRRWRNNPLHLHLYLRDTNSTSSEGSLKKTKISSSTRYTDTEDYYYYIIRHYVGYFWLFISPRWLKIRQSCAAASYRCGSLYTATDALLFLMLHVSVQIRTTQGRWLLFTPPHPSQSRLICFSLCVVDYFGNRTDQWMSSCLCVQFAGMSTRTLNSGCDWDLLIRKNTASLASWWHRQQFNKI